MKTPYVSFVIIISIVAMLLMGRVLAQSSAYTLADVMSAQSQYPQRINSIQVHFHAEDSVTPDFAESTPAGLQSVPVSRQPIILAGTQSWDTFFAAKGVKTLEQQHMQSGHSPPPVLYDGKSSYLMTFETSHTTGAQIKTAATKVEKRENPYPHVLSFGYQWNGQWIGDLLRRDNYRLMGVENDPQFGTLYRVQGVAEKGQLYPYNFTFWFAPKYGYLATRIEAQEADGRGMRMVYRVMDVMQQEGLWFARTGVREVFILGTNTVAVRYTMTLGDIKLNDVPDAMFDPTLTAGGKLYDQDANVVYRIGPEGEKMVDRRFTDPNESRNRLVGWLFVASLTLLLLLGLGALVRWQRQREAA